MQVGIFTFLLQYFPKFRAILVQKLWSEKKLLKSVFGYFKTKKKIQQKKVPMAIKLEGGGGLAIIGGTFFCGFPYATCIIDKNSTVKDKLNAQMTIPRFTIFYITDLKLIT